MRVKPPTDNAAQPDDLHVSTSERGGKPHAALKIAAIAAIACVGAFDLFFRLGVTQWATDEITYSDAGWRDFHGHPLADRTQPPLGKVIMGLFQVVLGRSATDIRISAALAGLITGIALAIIALRVAGQWAAIATAGAWFLLPHPGTVKLERFALVDVYMAMFTTLAVLFVVVWDKSRKWYWAVACGAAIGAAAASKAPGALVALPIAIFMLVRERPWRRSLMQLGIVAGAMVVAFVAAYIPSVSGMPAQVRYMIKFQAFQRSRGHGVLVAGHVYGHPPWWTQFWWQWDEHWLLALASVVALVLAIVAARRNAVRCLFLGVLAVNFGFFAFVSKNTLEHYEYAWSPIFALIIGLALYDMFRVPSLLRIAGVVVAIALSISAVQLLNDTARIQPGDYSGAAAMLRTQFGPAPRVALIGYVNVMHKYLPDSKLTRAFPKDLTTAKALLIDWGVANRHQVTESSVLGSDVTNWTRHRIGQLTLYVKQRP